MMLQHNLATSLDKIEIDNTLIFQICDVLEILGLCKRKIDGKGDQRWMAWIFTADKRWSQKFAHVWKATQNLSENMEDEGVASPLARLKKDPIF